MDDISLDPKAHEASCQEAQHKTTYTYEKLTTPSSIRIFSIKTGVGMLCCQIEEIHSPYPKYRALSYTWGDPNPHRVSSADEPWDKPGSYKIICNGNRMDITHNLYGALPQFSIHFNTSKLEIFSDQASCYHLNIRGFGFLHVNKTQVRWRQFIYSPLFRLLQSFGYHKKRSQGSLAQQRSACSHKEPYAKLFCHYLTPPIW